MKISYTSTEADTEQEDEAEWDGPFQGIETYNHHGPSPLPPQKNSPQIISFVVILLLDFLEYTYKSEIEFNCLDIFFPLDNWLCKKIDEQYFSKKEKKHEIMALELHFKIQKKNLH